MLSRVAEALYWMSRYVERAEDITRLLSVNFHALLDTQVEPTQRGWERLMAINRDEKVFLQYFNKFDVRSVSEFLLWHPANPNAVLDCINRARENARAVRGQISSEMWEHLNRLYFFVKDVNRDSVLNGPHEFFRQMRDGSQAFQGVTEATLPHGEAYEFIQVGKYLERADKTIRILDIKYAEASLLPEGSPAAATQLIAMLRSCSALEPFRQSHAAQLQASRVAEYLLLSRDFPRAVSFCLGECLRGVNTLSTDPTKLPGQLNNAQRTLGRLGAEMNYLDIEEVLSDDLHPYLDKLLKRLNHAGQEIERTFFNTRVILPGKDVQQAQQQ